MKKSPNQNSKKGIGPKRQEPSYMQLYKAKMAGRVKVGQTHDSGVNPIFMGQEICHSEKLIDMFQKIGNISNIKIEEDQSESQMIKNEYIETELMWFTKIDQMKSMISQIKIQCHEEKKMIQQLEKQLRDRKIKVLRLEENLKRSRKVNDELVINNCEDQIANLQDQYDRLTKESQEELNSVRNERDQLLQQNQQLDQEVQEKRQQVQSLSMYEQELFNDQLNGLTSEEDNMRQSMQLFQKQKTQMQQKSRALQQFRPIKEQMHRKYLELYEKMFMNKQFDKFQKLVRVKQQEIASLQHYENKKAIFNEKRSTIVYHEKNLIQKHKKIDQLTEMIKQKSTALLNLYEYQNTRHK